VTDAPLLLDSITDAGADARGRVVASGSHGGMYPAALASAAGARAVLFNDAGIGLERAGVAGVLALAGVGMAAAGVDCMSCRIGSAADMLARGRISVANAAAEALGVEPGMTVTEAAEAFAEGPMPTGRLLEVAEARRTVTLASGLTVVLVDSASLVTPEDAGAMVVTGSHGGLIGGDPRRALKAAARVASFNDAGFGPEDIGASRLPALDARGVAAVTVACASARIGDADSALATGVISRVNTVAAALGARDGAGLAEWLGRLPPIDGNRRL
jgi:hypothetical protein